MSIVAPIHWGFLGQIRCRKIDGTQVVVLQKKTTGKITPNSDAFVLSAMLLSIVLSNINSKIVEKDLDHQIISQSAGNH